jgi:hypothetical protein
MSTPSIMTWTTEIGWGFWFWLVSTGLGDEVETPKTLPRPGLLLSDG